MPDRLLRQLPKVDRILEWPEIAPLRERHGRPELVRGIRLCLERFREGIVSGAVSGAPGREQIVSALTEELAGRLYPKLRPLINGTGVVIHTNLGRSPLAEAAQEAVMRVCRGYCNLEYDLERGARGERGSPVEELILELTGAASALVVNNNAAAVMLALTTLATGRQVIVSRGELVEIGGSFRIPDVMRQSGALLVEVGATNRTRLGDYRAALSPETALLLKVHASNFAMVGFTEETPLGELASLGRESGVPVMLDAGSGCLLDLAPFGVAGERTVRQALEDGADLVTFSGDKLLGGPQAGIIAGRRELLEPMKRHPLLRALRPDKLSLAALEATLVLYRDERAALLELPVLRMLTMAPRELSRRAALIVRRLRRRLPSQVTLRTRSGLSAAGGGTMPLRHLATTLIEVAVRGASPQEVEAALRRTATPVVGRIRQGSFLLDARTIADHDITALGDSLREAAAALARNDQ